MACLAQGSGNAYGKPMSSARLVIAGLNGGTGKTILSLGTVRALTNAGHSVKPFKKGPDYIDAEWLGLAAGRAATNLDPFFLDAARLQSLFLHASAGASISIIEGNRGLYDGRDVTGSCSTAELARILDSPVVLAMDCTKMTRTAAAILSGVAAFEPGVKLAGVVLNRTANERHRSMLRQCIEHYTDIPVLGALPRLRDNPIPERHMGLVSDREFAQCAGELDRVAQFVAQHVDVERMAEIARSAQPLASNEPFWPVVAEGDGVRPRIGYVRDAALWFYYEENLEALRQAGADLVELRIIDGDPWPTLDGLYLGGGFPETLASELSACRERLAGIREAALAGLPVYAECGGFMVLGESIVMDGVEYPMSGVFPVQTVFHPKPQGLGYVEAEVVAENPFFPQGMVFRGHEFHYSACRPRDGGAVTHALRLNPGTGMGGGADGLVQANTFAAYTHIFGPAVQGWAERFVRAARGHRDRLNKGTDLS